MVSEKIKISLQSINNELQSIENRREHLIKESRGVVILCSQSIISLHQGHIQESQLKLDKAKDLYSANWVLRERGSGTRAVFEQALRRNGVNPENLRVSLELPSNEAVRAAVEAGAGATALSHTVARTGLIARQITKVPFQPIERSFLALTHRERTKSHAMRAFAEKMWPKG